MGYSRTARAGAGVGRARLPPAAPRPLRPRGAVRRDDRQRGTRVLEYWLAYSSTLQQPSAPPVRRSCARTIECAPRRRCAAPTQGRQAAWGTQRCPPLSLSTASTASTAGVPLHDSARHDARRAPLGLGRRLAVARAVGEPVGRRPHVGDADAGSGEHAAAGSGGGDGGGVGSAVGGRARGPRAIDRSPSHRHARTHAHTCMRTHARAHRHAQTRMCTCSRCRRASQVSWSSRPRGRRTIRVLTSTWLLQYSRVPLAAAAPMPVPPSTAAQLRTGGSAVLAGAGSGHVRRRTRAWLMADGAAGCAAVIRA